MADFKVGQMIKRKGTKETFRVLDIQRPEGAENLITVENQSDGRISRVNPEECEALPAPRSDKP